MANKWKPTTAYSNSLRDVAQQRTPAEIYRAELARQGKQTRYFIKQEPKWHQPKYLQSITRIQAQFRGFRHRKHFRLDSLREDRDNRVFLSEALAMFRRRECQKLVDLLSHGIPVKLKRNPSLLAAHCKALYRIRDIASCIEKCRELLAVDARHMDGQYLLGCCFASQLRWSEAFTTLSALLASNSDAATESMYKLHALVCTKLRPHRYTLAVTDYHYMIAQNPRDMNLYLELALLLAALQEFDLAQDNLAHILQHEPDCVPVLLARGRVFCCQRKWKKALGEFAAVLRVDPDNAIAQSEIALITEPLDETPFLSDDLLQL